MSACFCSGPPGACSCVRRPIGIDSFIEAQREWNRCLADGSIVIRPKRPGEVFRSPELVDLVSQKLSEDSFLLKRICPDCRGTGRYEGFAVIEDCRACGGRGATS